MPVRSVGPADRARRRPSGAACFEIRLNRLPFVLGDYRRHFHDDMLGLGFWPFGLRVIGVEAVFADIGRSRQDLMHGGDAPAPAVARPHIVCIQMFGDGFEAHRPAVAVTA